MISPKIPDNARTKRKKFLSRFELYSVEGIHAHYESFKVFRVICAGNVCDLLDFFCLPINAFLNYFLFPDFRIRWLLDAL